jgi:hypothetical protein
MLKNKKAALQEIIIKIILWIVFATIVGAAIIYLLKKFAM